MRFFNFSLKHLTFIFEDFEFVSFTIVKRKLERIYYGRKYLWKFI